MTHADLSTTTSADRTCGDQGALPRHATPPPRLRALVTAWYDCFGTAPVRTKDLVERAMSPRCEAVALRDALQRITSRGASISRSKTGPFIRRYEDRVVDGLRITRLGTLGGAQSWRLESTPEMVKQPTRRA